MKIFALLALVASANAFSMAPVSRPAAVARTPAVTMEVSNEYKPGYTRLSGTQDIWVDRKELTP